MANSYDISEIGAKLASDVFAIIEREIYDICKRALEEEVRRTVYSGMGTGYYDRTGDILKAVDITDKNLSGNTASFKVTVNPELIGIQIRDGEKWNAHAGVRGQDFREGVVEVLDEGTSGNSLYNHPGYNFFDSTANKLDSRLVGVMVSALRARGWDASVI